MATQEVQRSRIPLIKKRESREEQDGERTRVGRFTVVREEQTTEQLRESAKAMTVKGGMVLFWLVAGIAIVADLVDIFTTVLNAAGVGLSATVVGAAVGIPIVILSELIDNIAALFINLTLVTYFGFIGGGFALRLVIMSIGAIMDAVPVLEVLPITTLAFFSAFIFGRVVKKAVQFAESRLGKTIGAAVRGVRKVGRTVAKYA